MSLITQCPACSTMFRVVPDQLRISEGWVRCGHCDEVFDANAHLGTLDEAGASPAQAVAAQPDVVAEHAAVAAHEPSAASAPVDDDYNYDLGAAWENPRLVDPAQVELVVPDPDLYTSAPADDLAAPLQGLESQGMEPVADLHAFEPVAETAANQEEPHAYEPIANTANPVEEEALASVPAATEMPAEPAPESVSPSFMRGMAPPKKRWISNGVAAALCTVLLLALVVQVTRHERDRLAASAPALRPALTAACEFLACSVAPLREIEAIAIDSSAFTSVRPGVYLLGVTLKNTAATDLAVPALELTLTDMQDQPVVRKVLLAGDWSGKPATESIAAGAERTAKLPINVPPDAVPHKIAGYKLVAFYP